MIKVFNNSINFIQNLNSFSGNNNEVAFSDWFQFILLSLIDNSVLREEKNLGNLFTSVEGDLKKDDLANIFIKNDEKTSQKNFLENFDQIKLLLAYLLEKGILKEFNKENLNNNINSESSKDSNFINKFDFQSSEIDEEKISLIEKIFFQIFSSENPDFPKLNQLFENIEIDFLTEFSVIDKGSLKEGFLNSLSSQNIKDNIKNISQLRKTEGAELSGKDGKDLLKSDEIFFQIKDLSRIKDDIGIDTQKSEKTFQMNKENLQANLNTLQTGNKTYSKEGLIMYLNREKDKVLNKKKNFSVSNKVRTNSFQNKMEENFSRDLLILGKNKVNKEILEEKALRVRNKKELGKELNFYSTLNKKTRVELINRLTENSFIRGDWGIDKITKTKEIKTVSFQRLPDDLFEIIKNMSFEIQPQGEKKALIKLEPPEMGVLHLEIKTKDKNIEIIAKVERPEVLHDIKNNLHHIKSSLEDLGFNLKEFQLFLGSGFDGKAFSKDFKEGYSNKNKIKKPKKIENNGSIEEKMSVKFYNLNGRYYYIV